MSGAVVKGAEAVKAALRDIEAASRAANIRIVQRSEAVVEANAKRAFTKAHSAGTPTPSAPGEPPAVVTGTLRRSIRSDAVVPMGADGAMGRVYPTSIYSRIQELGGGFLPPRPYMRPAWEGSQEEIQAIAIEEYRKAVTGHGR